MQQLTVYTQHWIQQLALPDNPYPIAHNQYTLQIFYATLVNMFMTRSYAYMKHEKGSINRYQISNSMHTHSQALSHVSWWHIPVPNTDSTQKAIRVGAFSCKEAHSFTSQLLSKKMRIQAIWLIRTWIVNIIFDDTLFIAGIDLINLYSNCERCAFTQIPEHLGVCTMPNDLHTTVKIKLN